MHNGLYSVSEMAKVCNISPRQLRHYDKLGIISPTIRDELNGYRYYSKEQVQRVLMLKAMKNLGFSLEEISELLGQSDLLAFRDRVEAQVEMFRSELEQSYRRLEQAEKLFLQINKALAAIQQEEHSTFFLCEFPNSLVVSTRYCGPRSNHDLYSLRQAEIMALVERYDLKVGGPHFTIFHDHRLLAYSEEDRDLEAGVFIQGADNDCPQVHKYGGFQCLSGFYHGAYDAEQIKQVYQKMYEYAAGMKLRFSGISIEVYLVGPTLTPNVEEYITQIYLPILQN